VSLLSKFSMRFVYSLYLFACFIYQAYSAFWTSLQGTSFSDYSYGTCMMNNYVYLAGYTNGNLNGVTNAGSSDGFIIKMDTLGNTIWTKLFGTSYSDAVFGIACDATNNLVYGTGYTGGSFGGQSSLGAGDAFVIKVNGGDGTWISTKIFGGSSVDQGNAIDVDASGNVYVTGFTYSNTNTFTGCTGTNAGTEDIFVYKFDSSLNRVWCFLAGSSSSDYGNAIAVSDDGTKVAVVGYTFGTFYSQTYLGNGDGFYAVYDTSNGNKLYAGYVQTTAADTMYGVRFDNASNIIVCGSVGATIDGLQAKGLTDIYIGKFNSTGRIWSQLYGSTNADVSSALSINQDQTIAVTGRVSGSVWGKTFAGSVDFFWALLSSDGSLLNSDIIGSTAADYGVGIASNSSEMMVYVTGYTAGSLFGVTNHGGNDAFMFADSYYQAPVGFYATRGSIIPIPCPTSTLCDTIGLRVPKNCAVGNYCPNVTISVPCTTGSYCPLNSTADTDCPMGYYCVNPSTQVACTAGSLCDTVRKTASTDCPIGSFCPNITTSIACIPGQLCNTARLTSAGICPVGYTCANSSAAAVACSLGSLCNATGLTQETNCAVGYYCPTTLNAVACTQGSLCNTTRLTTNVDCPMGYYCPTTLNAIACTQGSLCNATRLTADVDCPIGYYCPSITANATLCPPGSYCNAIRLSQSVVCPVGSICPTSGMQTPTPCALGKLCNVTGLLQEQECPSGSTCSGGIASTCPLTTYCPANSTASQPCAAGFYCATPATQIHCNAACSCPQGSIVDCVVSSTGWSSSAISSSLGSSTGSSTGSSSTGSSSTCSSSSSTTSTTSSTSATSATSATSSTSSTSSSSSSGSSISSTFVSSTISSSSSIPSSSTGSNITDASAAIQDGSSSSVSVSQSKNIGIGVGIGCVGLLLAFFYCYSRKKNQDQKQPKEGVQMTSINSTTSRV